MTFFDILYRIFIGPLELFFDVIFSMAYRIVQHPGFAIVILSLAMNFLVLPLYRRADAMQEEERDRAARMKPWVDHIKRTFKGDERFMMLRTYYRQNDYKPAYALKGSLSLLLEVPFFMAAYQFLSHLRLLGGVSFGPIRDLGAPDAMFTVAGFTVNVLPVLMTLINFISGAIYTRGFPLKSKLQLYGMALVFLVFLYDSPAGLVFYWTLNNLFSLVKNVFYKLKQPGRTLAVLSAAAGTALAVFALAFYPQGTPVKRIFLAALGLALLVPLAVAFLPKREEKERPAPVPDQKLFFFAALFLTVLTGVTIPASVIRSSPQEFYQIQHFLHPLWYIVNSACMAAGTFLVWFGVFYRLASPRGKVAFERLFFALLAVSLTDYLFFGRSLGLLSPTLKFESGLFFSRREMLINAAVLAAVVALSFLITRLWRKKLFGAVAAFAVALAVLAPVDLVRIRRGVGDVTQQLIDSEDTPRIRLSKKGKNVVVMMLDRGMGVYLPYIFNELPELAEQFDGFTAYLNTISYSGNTNFAAPALFGGYEYTPEEINLRGGERLVDKHNEALKVMPALFRQKGFAVTVIDPTYVNYNWKTDLSIFKEMPGVSSYIAEGKFTPRESAEQFVRNNMRNFFCYSLMKIAPLAGQRVFYDHGLYFRSDTDAPELLVSDQVAPDLLHASGVSSLFMTPYYVLDNLSGCTVCTEDGTDTFLSMVSNLTHEPMLLQEPEYLPAPTVDNTEYERLHKDRFTLGGKTLRMETPEQVQHYENNVCALKLLGAWFDHLRESGVYDNTRIILAADHGGWFNHRDDLQTAFGFDAETYMPLLMVKDFGAKGFAFSDEFMTNADVPLLAADGLIEDPVNPFTGKPMTDKKKREPVQYLFYSDHWNVDENNGNVFLPGAWLELKGGNLFDMANWSVNETEATLPDRKKTARHPHPASPAPGDTGSR